MRGFNQFTGMGNLTKDPVRRETKNGRPIASFSIAMNKDWRDKNGQERKDVTFMDVVVFGPQAEPCLKYLQKGSPVFVQGEIKITNYTGKDNVQRLSVQTVARLVQFLGGRRSNENSTGSNSYPDEIPPFDIPEIDNSRNSYSYKDFEDQMASFGAPFDIDQPAPAIQPPAPKQRPADVQRTSPSGKPIRKLNFN